MFIIIMLKTLQKAQIPINKRMDKYITNSAHDEELSSIEKK